MSKRAQAKETEESTGKVEQQAPAKEKDSEAERRRKAGIACMV